ncbi:MAG: tRNA (guanosine(46)-N7)-methyltransferase TrmB [Hyphomicrobiaceae bacterium]|nr:tRNA (guanosine(46)-N7)-methyltransferase TrmB [Hyphomicrobiaceae bacterium]MCC0009186.1 tRNA (guanosine(46)-N7)-methyltransferase TrmB [Hyphomicrobiaceae bacterium]
MTDNDNQNRGHHGQPGTPPPDVRSFGRRRGRTPSDHQQSLLKELLPRIAVDPAQIKPETTFKLSAQLGMASGRFAQTNPPVWLEIGFGGGEHLIWQARQNPGVVLIGSEPYQDGVLKVLNAVADGGLDHVRLLADDVRPFLRTLPPASLDRVFILFPDPWPKRRHNKRRLIQPALVSELARVMKPGSELRFATDIGDYARTGLLALYANGEFEWTAQSPSDWRERPVDLPPTRYETKAGREGRRCYFFSLRRQ